MTLPRSILFASAMGLAVSGAFADEYNPQARGLLHGPQALEATASAGATAPRPATHGLESLFSAYDADRDRQISWQEAQADPALVRWFAQADADRNAALTLSEFNTAVALSASS